MYADDTTLYCCLEDKSRVCHDQAMVNQKLHKIDNWFIANGIELNTSKPTCMISGKPNTNIPVFFTDSLYVYFKNTVHIKIVQTMHRSYKLI